MEVWSRYFDSAYYIRSYPDVARRGVAPFIHFLVYGNAERRNPSNLMNLDDYLTRYPDVVKMGVNGLLHYALFGQSEGRTTMRAAPCEKVGQVLQTSLPMTQQPLLTDVVPAMIPHSSAASPAALSPLVINNAWRPDRPLLSVVIPCF